MRDFTSVRPGGYAAAVTLLPARKTIRVFIVEDQPDVREGLALLIGDGEGFECGGAWASMEEFLPHVTAGNCDVVLADIGLPGMSGIEGARRLRGVHPHIPILMLTVYSDDERIFAAMCAGACGYLLKSTPPAKLLESLREVAGGGAVMSPSVARRVVNLFRTFRPSAKAGYGLSPREMRILEMLGEGHHYKTAAAELGISVHTVNCHLKAIYGKLQVHSKSEAVAKAFREGLIG